MVCFCINGPYHLLYVLLPQCKLCDMFICIFHVLMYVSVWPVCADTQLSSLNGLIPYHSVVDQPWTSWQREGASWQCSHLLRYTTWKTLSMWVPEHRTQQDYGTASCTLWTWIAIGKWCSCRHSFPPPACRVVLYTLTLFIDDYKDYAFSLACQQVCQLAWTVSCWGLCVAEMEEVTWLWTIT